MWTSKDLRNKKRILICAANRLWTSTDWKGSAAVDANTRQAHAMQMGAETKKEARKRASPNDEAEIVGQHYR